MTLDVAWRLAAGVILVALNAFFVVTEFALTRLRQLPPEEFRETAGLRRAWQMTERLEIYLTGCQLGISATSILLGVITEPAVTRVIEPVFRFVGVETGSVRVVSVVVAIVLINLVHKIYGEQAPTYLGVERPRAVAQYLATPLYWWVRIMYPVIYFGDGLAKASLGLFGIEITRSWTEESEEEGEEVSGRVEMRRQMGEVLSRGRIEEDRREEVLATLAIGELPVREVMIPRERMVVLSDDESVEESFRRIAEGGFVRYPLRDATGELSGVIYVPSLFGRLDELRAGTASLEELAVPAATVPADLSVSELIDRLQEEGQEVALVREDGRTLGMVTVTDAFEAIAGEVEDPLD